MENSLKIIKYNLNYVYQELIIEFINNKGHCNDSTYNLINWEYILDSDNSIRLLMILLNNFYKIKIGVYEILDTKSNYQLYISYLIKLFSKYLKDNDSCILLNLNKSFEDKKLFPNSIQIILSITDNLKKALFKKV
jgi:hypothetical protein